MIQEGNTLIGRYACIITYSITENWYDHKPPSVLKSYGLTLLWDFTIIQDIQIRYGQKYVKEYKCYIINMIIPSDKKKLQKNLTNPPIML